MTSCRSLTVYNPGRSCVRESFLANHLIGIAIEIGVVKSLAKCLSISNPISIAISSLARNISRTRLGAGLTTESLSINVKRDRIGIQEIPNPGLSPEKKGLCR